MNSTNSYQGREELMNSLYSIALTHLLKKVDPSYTGEVKGSKLNQKERNILRSALLKSEEQRNVYEVNEKNVDEVLNKRLKFYTEVYEDYKHLIKEVLKIPEDLTLRLWNVYIPLCEWIVEKRKSIPEDKAYILGINGGQGSGKSTLVDVEKLLLERYGLLFRNQKYYVVTVSIDDLYLTYEEREALKQSEPRFKFRGVPGTHDVDLAVEIFEKLKNREAVEVPMFDKSLKNGAGDRADREKWKKVEKGAEIVLFEGWITGIRPLPEQELKKPSGSDFIDKIETRDDPNGTFRKKVNEVLKRYEKWFDYCNNLIVLKVPSLEKIREWRKLQEKKLIAEKGTGMSEKELKRFLDYFAPTTQRYVLPLDEREQTDLVFMVGADHDIKKVIAKK